MTKKEAPTVLWRNGGRYLRNDDDYRWVGAAFKKLYPNDWYHRIAMATNHKIFVDENLVGPLERALKKIFRKVVTPEPGTKDHDIIEVISGKGFILITINERDFRLHFEDHFDLIVVPSIAASEAAADKWAKKIKEEIAATKGQMRGRGTRFIKLLKK